jgi:hypothetical protein
MLMLITKNRNSPFPELKSFQIPLAGETMKDGERSSENGLNPLKYFQLFSIGQNRHNLLYRAVSKTVVALEIIIFFR